MEKSIAHSSSTRTLLTEKSSVHSSSTRTLSTVTSTELDEKKHALPLDVAERLVLRIEKRVAHILCQSKFIQAETKIQDTPTFGRDDLELGATIGCGSFANIREIRSFHIVSDLTKGENDERQYIVKHLNPELAVDLKKLGSGARDLVMEAHFLSTLNHKNIIQLKGLCESGISGFAETGRVDCFFLVLDRLRETLNDRIKDWRRISKENKMLSVMKGRANAHRKLFTEQTRVAIDVADALDYLHSNRIVYRDLKPANIGFDRSGVVKIFDFGTATELPEGSNPDSAFDLAGNVGTARYMAVEVIRGHSYNVKADVFSFSILLWEIMALTKPYEGWNGEQVQRMVSAFGHRPTIPRGWPAKLRRILQKGWKEDLRERPHMVEFKDVLIKL